jgi:hypothetical protein
MRLIQDWGLHLTQMLVQQWAHWLLGDEFDELVGENAGAALGQLMGVLLIAKPWVHSKVGDLVGRSAWRSCWLNAWVGPPLPT